MFKFVIGLLLLLIVVVVGIYIYNRDEQSKESGSQDINSIAYDTAIEYTSQDEESEQYQSRQKSQPE